MNVETSIDKLNYILHDLLIRVEYGFPHDKVLEAIAMIDDELIMDNPHIDCGNCRNSGRPERCNDCCHAYSDRYSPKE